MNKMKVMDMVLKVIAVLLALVVACISTILIVDLNVNLFWGLLFILLDFLGCFFILEKTVGFIDKHFYEMEE